MCSLALTPTLSLHTVNVMRCSDDVFHHMTMLTHAKSKISSVLDALDYLGSCPWKVNEKVHAY